MEQGDAGRVEHNARGVDSFRLADGGHIARRIDVAAQRAAGDVDIAVEDRGGRLANQVGVGIGVGKEGVVASQIVQTVVAAIETVAGAEDGLVDRAAVDIDVGLGQVARSDGGLEDTDAAHNVGTAIDHADVAAANLDIGVVERTGALAAAIDGVGYEVGAADDDVGAALGALLVVGVVGRGYIFNSIVVGICHAGQHHTLVAAAIDVVDTALGEVQRGQARHIGSVVAAKEAADVEDAGRGAIGDCGAVGIGRLGEGVERVGDVDVDDGGSHVGAVAATEAGVDLAAVDDDVDILALHLVAAAKEVADTVLAAVAGPGVAGQDVAAKVHRAAVVGLGARHGDVVRRASTQRAAIVVAAKDGIDGTAVDGDLGAVVSGVGDKRILGTAKQGVDEHKVGIDRDGSLADRGDGARSHIGLRAVHLGDAGAEGAAIQHADTHIGAGLVAVVLVVAVATAVDRAHADATIGNAELIARHGTDNDGRTVGTTDGTGNVVAAIDGRDGVAVDDGHLGLAADVGHTAAAKDGAANSDTSRNRLSLQAKRWQQSCEKDYKFLKNNSHSIVHCLSVFHCRKQVHCRYLSNLLLRINRINDYPHLP